VYNNVGRYSTASGSLKTISNKTNEFIQKMLSTVYLQLYMNTKNTLMIALILYVML